MSRAEYNVRSEYIGTGLLDSYTFDFKITALSQIMILVTDENFIETFKVRGDDTTFLTSVTFDSINGAGTVLLADVLPDGHFLTILLADDAPVQESEFKNKGDFSLKRIESALDVVAGAVQRLAYLAKRSLRLSDTMTDADITGFNTELPVDISDVANAGKLLVIGDDGKSFDLGPNYHEIEAVAVTEAAAASAAAALASANAADISEAASLASSVASAASASAASTSASNANTSATNAASSASSAASAAATAALAAGYHVKELYNIGLLTSVASSALTIYLTDRNNSTPGSGTAACRIGFRSATLTAGTFTEVTVTSQISLVISSGSTLGQVSGKQSKMYIYLINNAGTAELAVSTTLYREDQLVSTTAEGGAGAADSSSAIYSTTARSNVVCRLIGTLLNTQATAGTWASAGTVLSVGSYTTLLSDPVVFSGVRGSTQSVTANVTDVIFTAVKDSYSAWNSSFYTLPDSGDYLVSCCLADNGSNSWYTQVYINGTGSRYLGSQVGGAIAGGCMLIPDLKAGDTISIRVTGTTTINASSGTGISIMKVK